MLFAADLNEPVPIIYEEFFESGIIDGKAHPEFQDLLKCIKSAGSKDNIKLNDFIEKDNPDIDIHIKCQCAIFLKNSRIEATEISQVWKEVEMCKRRGINKIFYCINFIKNIDKIEYVRESFEKIRSKCSLQVDILDIKDLVGTLLDELKKSGKTKSNFSHLDLYRVLDY